MVSTVSFLALAAGAAAQAYYGGDSSSTVSSAAPAQSFACNPAHEYPEGRKCISTNGGLTLLPPTTSAASATQTFACNPAHQYPSGVSCATVSGSLTLVVASATASASAEDCYARYNTCRGAPDANFSYCASQYAQCLGYNPFNNDGTNTVTPKVSVSSVVASSTVTASSASPSSTGGCQQQYDTCRTTRVNGLSANQAYCASKNAECEGNCQTQYDTCRTTRVNGLSANQAACAAQYAGCLGRNPFTTSAATSTAPPPSGTDYVTEVVTAYTTYCPSPTTFAHGNKTYTVTSATTLTITDCPGGCKITKPVTSLSPATTVTAVVPYYTTVCPSPTTVTIQSKTYTVTSSTVITVSCPGGCTVTTPVSKLPPVTSASVGVPSGSAGVPSRSVSVSTTYRAPASPTSSTTQYTGAADKLAGSAALMLGALGLFAL